MNQYRDIKNSEIKSLTSKNAYELSKKGYILIDVREDYLNAFKFFDVDKYIKIPLSELSEKIIELNLNENYIIADSAGLRSMEAAKLLIYKGFKNIYNLAGGIIQWERSGFPIIEDKNYRLSGSCACQLKPREGSSKKS